MIWLFLEFLTIICLWCVVYVQSTNMIIFLSALLIWYTLRELIGVIEKRRRK